MTTGFKPCKAHDATMYSVFVRIPLAVRGQLLAVSGTGGIYIEPRSQDGRSVDDSFSVLWLPRLSHAELVHLRQTRPCIVGLARVADRRGVRTLLDDAEALHKAVKPDVVYLPGGPRVQYLAGPFPYGCSRQSLARAFEKIAWAAKPLQPSVPVPNRGNMWLVQAAESPPVSVLRTSHGEVVITLHKPLQQQAQDQVTTPVGSANTIALCEQPAPVNEDLLQKYDPWKSWHAKTPTPARPTAQVAAAPSATESLVQMEQRVQNAVLAKLPPGLMQGTPMERDDLDERVVALESQVQVLLSKQGSLEQSVAATADRHSTQLNQMQTQINQQGQQLHGHLEAQNQQMQALFEGQMAQIRSLLSKRGRDDGPLTVRAEVQRCQLMVCSGFSVDVLVALHWCLCLAARFC